MFGEQAEWFISACKPLLAVPDEGLRASLLTTCLGFWSGWEFSR